MANSVFIGTKAVAKKGTPESDGLLGYYTNTNVVSQDATNLLIKASLKRELLSGENGDPYGLVDFTGEYPSANCPRLVMAKSAKEALDRAVARVNALEPAKKEQLFPGYGDREWKPSISETYRTYDEQAALRSRLGSTAALPGTSGHEGGADIDIHRKDATVFPTAAGWTYFKKSMQEEGFSRVNDTTENHHFQLRTKDMPKGSSWIAYQNRTGGDAQIYAKNNGKEYTAKKYGAKAYRQSVDAKPISGSNAGLSAIETRVDPAGERYTPGTCGISILPTTLKKLDTLDYMIKDAPLARLAIIALPTHKIPDEIKKGNYAGLPDKVDKNVTPSNCPVGFKSKIGTPAQIKIALSPDINPQTDAEAVEAFDAFKAAGVDYIDCFVLQSAQYVNEEKYFVFQALNGETTTFFFGGKPVVYSFSGIVYDTYNQEWLNDFEFYYQEYLRGSRALLNKTRMFIIYSDQILEGFMLDVTVRKGADTNDSASFSFNFILVQKTVIGGYETPIQRAALKPPEDSGNYYIQHMVQLMTNNLGMVFTSTQDSWKSKSIQTLASPPLDVPEIIAKMESPALKDFEVADKKLYTGTEFKNGVNTAAKTPGATRAVEGAKITTITTSDGSVIPDTPDKVYPTRVYTDSEIRQSEDYFANEAYERRRALNAAAAASPDSAKSKALNAINRAKRAKLV